MNLNKIQNKWWIWSSCIQDKLLVYYDLAWCVFAFVISVPVVLANVFYETIIEMISEVKQYHNTSKENIRKYGKRRI